MGYFTNKSAPRDAVKRKSGKVAGAKWRSKDIVLQEDTTEMTLLRAQQNHMDILLTNIKHSTFNISSLPLAPCGVPRSIDLSSASDGANDSYSDDVGCHVSCGSRSAKVERSGTPVGSQPTLLTVAASATGAQFPAHRWRHYRSGVAPASTHFSPLQTRCLRFSTFLIY